MQHSHFFRKPETDVVEGVGKSEELVQVSASGCYKVQCLLVRNRFSDMGKFSLRSKFFLSSLLLLLNHIYFFSGTITGLRWPFTSLGLATILLCSYPLVWLVLYHYDAIKITTFILSYLINICCLPGWTLLPDIWLGYCLIRCHVHVTASSHSDII